MLSTNIVLIFTLINCYIVYYLLFLLSTSFLVKKVIKGLSLGI